MHWADLLSAHHFLAHAWMYPDLHALLRDLAWINGALGLVCYALFRILLAAPAAALCAAALGLGFAAASERKLDTLGLPLLPWDLLFVADARAFAAFLGISFAAALAGLLVLGASGWLLWLLRRRLLRQRGHGAAILVAAAGCFGVYHWLVLPPSPPGLSGQVQRIPWDLAANQTNYGPYYTFVAWLDYLRLPVGSRAARDRAADLLREPVLEPAAGHEQPDVVAVLSEAFTLLPRALFPTRFTCLEGAPVGQLQTPSWGGYTANVESELLTGYPQALFPPGSVPYQMYLKRPLPQALPRVFARAGYATAAVHTYDRDFFSRPAAYAALGFHEYRGLEDLPAPERRGWYVDDEVLFSQVLQLLDRPSPRPQLVHAVSMMAHLPYGLPGRYPVRPELSGRLPDALAPHAMALEQYASMVHDHERRFCGFLERLRARARRTLVLFYGDHYPSFGSMAAYRAIHEVLRPGTKFQLQRDYTRTPVFLYDNRRGFLPVPSQPTVYNLGRVLLDAAGIQPPGLWALPHKHAGRAPSSKELDVMRAHLRASLFPAE